MVSPGLSARVRTFCCDAGSVLLCRCDRILKLILLLSGHSPRGNVRWGGLIAGYWRLNAYWGELGHDKDQLFQEPDLGWWMTLCGYVVGINAELIYLEICPILLIPRKVGRFISNWLIPTGNSVKPSFQQSYLLSCEIRVSIPLWHINLIYININLVYIIDSFCGTCQISSKTGIEV